MGNICSIFKRPKKNSIPTSLEELLETQVVSETDSVEETARKSPWLHSFLQYPGLKDQDRREMFFFRLQTSQLGKTSPNQLETTKNILLEIGRRYFSDRKYQEPSIHFTDIHNLVPQIFRLFDSGLRIKKDVISLRAKLLELSEDESVRDALEPAFSDFIKKPSYHHMGVLQACILSLL